jgi:hypothetical protein
VSIPTLPIPTLFSIGARFDFSAAAAETRLALLSQTGKFHKNYDIPRI